MADERSEPLGSIARDLNVCAACAHFESEDEVPYCAKFKSWADSVVQDCGGPY